MRLRFRRARLLLRGSVDVCAPPIDMEMETDGGGTGGLGGGDASAASPSTRYETFRFSIGSEPIVSGDFFIEGSLTGTKRAVAESLAIPLDEASGTLDTSGTLEIPKPRGSADGLGDGATLPPLSFTTGVK